MSEEMEMPVPSPRVKEPLIELKRIFDKNDIKYNKCYAKAAHIFFRFIGTKGILDKAISLIEDKYDILESGVPQKVVYEKNEKSGKMTVKRDKEGFSIREDKGFSFVYLRPKKE